MESGFLGSLRLVGFASGAAIAFIAMPAAYEMTWPWLSANVLSGYGEAVAVWAPWFWSFLLFVLIYALTRTVLLLLVSIGGLLMALTLIFRRWWD